METPEQDRNSGSTITGNIPSQLIIPNAGGGNENDIETPLTNNSSGRFRRRRNDRSGESPSNKAKSTTFMKSLDSVAVDTAVATPKHKESNVSVGELLEGDTNNKTKELEDYVD